MNGVSGSGSVGDRTEESRPEGTGARRLNLFGGFFASGKSPREGDAGGISRAEPALQTSRTMEAQRAESPGARVDSAGREDSAGRADSAGTPAEQAPVLPPRTPLHQSASEGALNTPTAPPPPPPPRRVASSGGPAPPPPPPPPVRSKSGALLTQSKSKLKRSTKMGALYRGLKRKVEGTGGIGGWEAGQEDGGGADGKGPKGAGGATAAGMAEMLGEITKRWVFSISSLYRSSLEASWIEPKLRPYIKREYISRYIDLAPGLKNAATASLLTDCVR